jgi:ADP-ribose pyrophosphatase YjhB (NUDIX family)
MEAKFCLSCGHALEVRSVDGTDRKACTNCSFVYWGDYSIGVGALVRKADKILLVRRSQDPGKGRWTIPGGYIEQFETIEKTAEREVFEEANVHAKVKNIFAIRDQPRAVHNVYIAFEMEYIDGTPTPDGYEADAAGFFDTEEMKTMNVAPLTQWMVDALLSGKEKGLVMDEHPVFDTKGDRLFRCQ